MSEFMRTRALRVSALALFILFFQVAGMAQDAPAQDAPAQVAPAQDEPAPGAAANSASAGATAKAAPAALDLEAARAGALKSSAALRKAGIAVDSALAAEAAQRAAALPSLGASLSLAPQVPPTTNDKGVTSYGSISASLSSSVTIWKGGKNAILLAIDALATQAARSSAREAYFSAIEEADAAYYAALQARDAADAAKADLDAASLSLSIAQAKLETGTITKAALLKAQAELATKETALGLARNGLQSAMVKLSSIAGLSLPFELAAVDFDAYSELMSRLSRLDDAGLEAFVAAACASGLKNNPSIATAQGAVDKARLALASSKADYLPSVSASASAGAKYTISSTGTLSPSLSIGVSASIPLDYWSAAPSIKVKELALGSAGLDLAEAKRSLELELRTAAYSWVAASRTVSSAAKALEYAESNYGSVLENYKLSLVAASELSDASLLVSADRNSLNAAKYGFLRAFAALRTLAGIEKDADLVGLLEE